MFKFWRLMDIISSSIFSSSNFSLHFFRLQILSPSFFPSSNFGYFNTVAAHSTFHALKLPRLTVSLRKSKGKHGGQGIPYRWGGPGELWNVALEHSMNIISSSIFPSSIFFVFKFWRLQFPRFNFSSSFFSLQYFSLQFFVFKVLWYGVAQVGGTVAALSARLFSGRLPAPILHNYFPNYIIPG